MKIATEAKKKKKTEKNERQREKKELKTKNEYLLKSQFVCKLTNLSSAIFL